MTATTAEGLEGGVVNKNTTTISTTHTALLPKESEQTERKRPLAIQELLEKKRARLAHYSGMTTLMTTNGEEENRKNEHGKTAKTMKKERNEVEFLHLGDPELADLFSHICNGEGDSETTSSNSTDTAKKHGNSSSKCHSFGRLLRRATEKSSAREHLNLSPASDSSLAFALQQQQTELEYMAVTEEERQQQQKAPKASKAGSSCADVNESPLSKSVPHNKVFAQVPGRLSLLSNVIKYKMSVGEVKRRLMGPEAFNFSLLGALLRRAKMPEKSQMLVDELSQVGLSIPRGRRRLSQITLLSALTEAESIQFANDFKKITEAEFPVHQLAVETLQRQKDNMDLKNRLDKLKAAFKVTQEFQEIIEKDRSPVMDNKMDPILSEEVQNSLSTFSMLTHGFGNPAIQVGISCFVRMLQHQIQIIEDRLLL